MRITSCEFDKLTPDLYFSKPVVETVKLATRNNKFQTYNSCHICARLQNLETKYQDIFIRKDPTGF
ncbi:MAG: hypothetical protein HC803_08895 [Saprospiraceae bacterium]|nr:hypothetical protein [Saprospiraceae bacterium]